MADPRPGVGWASRLVREMVQAHGGAVVAESPGEGRGSPFTVRLPLGVGASAVVAEDPRKRTIAALPRLDILIVDDDGDVRDLLGLLLQSRGAAVAEQAQKRKLEQKPKR